MLRRFDEVQPSSLELFCGAAELGSFAAAARAAKVTPAAVSRSAERRRRALLDLAEAERDIGGRQSSATGRVRISVPTSYGHYRLLPRMGAFRAHPGIRVAVHLVEDGLATSRLIELLSETRGVSRPFNLIYPHARRLPAGVKALVDFLIEQRRSR